MVFAGEARELQRLEVLLGMVLRIANSLALSYEGSWVDLGARLSWLLCSSRRTRALADDAGSWSLKS